MSPITTYIVQPCPVCGRSLHVPVQLLGKKAACQHCRATFVARDAAAHAPVGDPRTVLMQRVNAILGDCLTTHCVL